MKKEQIEIKDIKTDLEIEIRGTAKVFGGNDLKLRAILLLIDSLDYKFQEEEDPDISQKDYLKILQAIGKQIKQEGFFDNNLSEIEIVKQFLDYNLRNLIRVDNWNKPE